jgi:Fis family transcriptional regulator, factor for inversion stimulation protein
MRETPVDSQASTRSPQVSIKASVNQNLAEYLRLLEDQDVHDLHALVLAQVEPPLLEQVMAHVGQNQSKAAVMLGLSRGTLRTKLNKYGLL